MLWTADLHQLVSEPMAHNRRVGFAMGRRHNRNNDMEEIRGLMQELNDRVARFETRGRGGEGSDEEEDVNPFHGRALLREPRGEGQGNRYFDMKVEIPEFEGRNRSDEFVDWLNSVERIFDFKEVPENKKVKAVAIKLTKFASAWWEQLKVRRERLGKPKITSWEKMKKEMRKRFLPDNYIQNNYLKLHSLRQGARSVDEFTEEFDLLTIRSGVTEDEEHTIARYLGGLRPEIRDVVVLQPYWSYNDVYKLAIQVEKQQR